MFWAGPPAVICVSEFKETTTFLSQSPPTPTSLSLTSVPRFASPSYSISQTNTIFSSWPHSNPPPWLFHTPCSIFSPCCLPLTPSALFNPNFLPSGCLNGGNSAAISGGYKKWACYVSLAKGRVIGGVGGLSRSNGSFCRGVTVPQQPPLLRGPNQRHGNEGWWSLGGPERGRGVQDTNVLACKIPNSVCVVTSPRCSAEHHRLFSSRCRRSANDSNEIFNSHRLTGKAFMCHNQRQKSKTRFLESWLSEYTSRMLTMCVCTSTELVSIAARLFWLRASDTLCLCLPRMHSNNLLLISYDQSVSVLFCRNAGYQTNTLSSSSF